MHSRYMTGRRRDSRYRLVVPYEGSLLLMQDVVIEQQTGDELFVLSHTPATTTDSLTVEVMSSEPSRTLNVEVTRSTPVIVGGDVRHRVRLEVVRAPGTAEDA